MAQPEDELFRGRQRGALSVSAVLNHNGQALHRPVEYLKSWGVTLEHRADEEIRLSGTCGFGKERCAAPLSKHRAVRGLGSG